MSSGHDIDMDVYSKLQIGKKLKKKLIEEICVQHVNTYPKFYDTMGPCNIGNICLC